MVSIGAERDFCLHYRRPWHKEFARIKVAKSKRKRFPYELVAQLWAEGKTIAEIAENIDCINQDCEDGDRTSSVRHAKAAVLESEAMKRTAHSISVAYPVLHGVEAT